MKVTREQSPAQPAKRSDDKKRRRPLAKILSAFGRGRKTANSCSSAAAADAMDAPEAAPVAPSPRVNISSVSSSSSFEARPQPASAAGAGPTAGRRHVSTELAERGTQTAALSSAPSHYRRHHMPADTSYSSYAKYRSAGYPSSRVPKCEMDRHTAELSATGAVPSWQRSRRRTPTADRRHKRSSATEMDILSFFDTGSVDHGYAYKCANEVAASDAIHVAREGGAIERLPSHESQSGQQQLMLEDKDVRSADHRFPGHRRSRADCQPLEEVVEDAACADDRMRPASLHLQTVKNGRQSADAGPQSFWYCEKMDKSKAKRIPDANECEPVGCCERFADPTKVSQQQAERLQRTGGSLFNRQITTEEKRRLAKIGAIILATAGVAALIMLMLKYKRQAQLCKSMLGDECDVKSTDTFDDDDDDGVCIFEKLDKVKCQNSNFKAMMSNSEKLIEHDDRVCASQDFKKVTKRLKDPNEARAKDVFCPCSDKEYSEINKKKCFDNF